MTKKSEEQIKKKIKQYSDEFRISDYGHKAHVGIYFCTKTITEEQMKKLLLDELFICLGHCATGIQIFFLEE